MRFVCYLGTRGCRGTLEQALGDHHDELHILVPAEPALLGPQEAHEGMEEGLVEVASILAERARARAVDVARTNEQALAGVFDASTEPSERIEAEVLEPPLAQRLVERTGELDAAECYVARDTLDILDEAGIRLGEALDRVEVELVTR